jgi:hypothetical protein
MGWAPPELGLELRQPGRVAACLRLYGTIVVVANPAHQSESQRRPPDEIAKPDTLHRSFNPVPTSHGAGRRRSRTIPTMMGITEIPMMKRMTRLKLSRTTGRLPKK